MSNQDNGSGIWQTLFGTLVLLVVLLYYPIKLFNKFPLLPIMLYGELGLISIGKIGLIV